MVVECSSLKETQNLKDYKIHLPGSRGIFPWNSAVGTWLFSSYAASARKNKTLKRLSGLIEDNSFKRLVAYEDDLWRTPGATDNVFSVDQEMFWHTVTDQSSYDNNNNGETFDYLHIYIHISSVYILTSTY